MLNDSSTTRRTVEVALRFLPLFAFVFPIVMLYLIPNTFNWAFANDATWKGRIFYVFFLWLISLEIILAWEGLRTEKIKKESGHLFAFEVKSFFRTLRGRKISNKKRRPYAQEITLYSDNSAPGLLTFKYPNFFS